MADEILGTCDSWKQPHPKGALGTCKNWAVTPPTAPVELKMENSTTLGVWVNGMFIPVDLGSFVTILTAKDSVMDKLDKENLQLNQENQKLRYDVQAEHEIGLNFQRCLKDELDKAANVQMFGVQCVCKWRGGKVTDLCGAHHSVIGDAVDKAKKEMKDVLAEKYRRLVEAL